MIPRRIRRDLARSMAAFTARETREPGETRQMARARWNRAFFRQWSRRYTR